MLMPVRVPTVRWNATCQDQTQIVEIGRQQGRTTGRKAGPMNTQVQHNIQRVLATAAALVVIGGALNVFVFETLGSFDAASVILTLYVASWAFVLGDIGLILSALWYFMNRRAVAVEQKSAQLDAAARSRMDLETSRLTKPCYGC
jgi:hypothetical protein